MAEASESKATPRVPKSIVLFSDGTGNSSAKLFKTNVWRTYEALDLSVPADAGTTPRQVAYYDDGVGTSALKPLALVGGIFGWGLKRNVLDLYMFLCRNYEPGDRIYAFGFSRGAFTIRLLVGLVAREGALDCPTEAELSRYAHDAYRHYRRGFAQDWGLARPMRALRDGAIRVWRKARGHTLYRNVPKREVQEIAFVGVWDTVAAYGLPLSELTRGIDKWVWPLSMPDYRLSAKVKCARHALALDDERDTFHPLIWDEAHERSLVDGGIVAPGRLRQVWFAGMHSDVGGGYPDDSLAYVSLEWMLDAAAAAGLRFKPERLAAHAGARSIVGPIHDSRRGLGGYYRYQPRKIAARLDPPDPTTLIMRDPAERRHAALDIPCIHESVFARIRSSPDQYAPIVLPATYTVFGAEKSEADPHRRAEMQEWVWNIVWKKRVVYFSAIGATLLIVVLPFFAPDTCLGLPCLVSPVIAGSKVFLPGLVEGWVDAAAREPVQFSALAVLLAALLFRGRALQSRTRDEMRELWCRSLALPVTAATTAGRAAEPPRNWVFRLRSCLPYQKSLRTLKWRIVPLLFGMLVIAALLLFLMFAAHRIALQRAEARDWFCTADAPSAPFTGSTCWRQGTAGAALPPVEKGRTYRLSLTPIATVCPAADAAVAPSPDAQGPWCDQAFVSKPTGYVPPWYVRIVGGPLRRSLDAPWFRPLLKIRAADGSFLVLPLDLRRADPDRDDYIADFDAALSGTVSLSVNDAVVPFVRSATRLFYDNNTGGAEIRLVPFD